MPGWLSSAGFGPHTWMLSNAILTVWIGWIITVWIASRMDHHHLKKD